VTSSTTPSIRIAGLQFATASHVGRVRSVNQDACGDFGDPANGRHLFFVADGMGGHRAGEVASRYAVEAVGRAFKSGQEAASKLLEDAFDSANSIIFESASENDELAGMGTTGVALLLSDREPCCIAHVGDSRAYRLRDGRLAQLTGDHSVVGELVRRGQLTSEEARVHPQNNEILRALGTQAQVEVELTPAEVRMGDIFLLCSDGLSGMLPDLEIEGVLRDGLADGRAEAAQETADRLVDLANEAGGTDNISVQIVVVAEVAEVAGADIAGAASADETAREQGNATEDARAGLSPALILALVALAGLVLFYCFSGADPSG